MCTPVHPVRIATPDCTRLQAALLLRAFAEQRPSASFHLSFRTEQGYGHGTDIHEILCLRLCLHISVGVTSE
jgi:hypothetical protein